MRGMLKYEEMRIGILHMKVSLIWGAIKPYAIKNAYYTES